MLNCLPIALSPFFLENKFHGTFCMFHDCGFNFDTALRDYGVPTQGVLSGTQFMDLIESKNVPNLYISKTGYGEEVAG